MTTSRSPGGDRLHPFVPRLVLDLAVDEGNVHRSIAGSMLSADISGFTALSERLARKGREGAEELTELINSCFTGLIDAAASFGGEVIKFGGDALLVMFTGDGHEVRAGHAAQTMQVVLAALGKARRASLAMTVGVASGPFNVFLVGSQTRELLVCGPAASEVIRLEAAAGSGQVLASPTLGRSLNHRVLDGGVVIWEPATYEPVDRPTNVDLTPFLPGVVVEQLSAFSDTGGEHRLVTVGFVSLSGIAASLDSAGTEATAAELGAVVDLINAASNEFSVNALHSDIAPDGVKFVLCAGAPLSAGNSSDALLQTALRISESDSPFTLKQGVQRGRVFAGFLGSPSRRNYTLMGDAVNTAARMLGPAEDRDIVAVADVVRDTRSIFVAQELEPFLVKGKADPISAFKVLDITGEVRRSGEYAELVGRETEVALIEEAVQERGYFVHLTGDGGSGKSRLIDRLREAVDANGFDCFQSTCSPYGSTSPYALFRGLLRSGFGIDLHTDAETTGDLLTKVVRQDAPHLGPWLPLLAGPFGAWVEPTLEVEALAAEFRRTRTHEVVADFLDTALDGPIALIAEDIHWADDASMELLEFLAGQTRARGWVTFTTQRPNDNNFGSDVAEATMLPVGPLEPAAIRELAVNTCEVPLSDQQLDLIAKRSGGNPLFAIELARAVGKGTDELPDSVEKLISSRLDELSPEGRRLLGIASIFGVEMKERDLRAVLNIEAPELDPRWDEVSEFLTRGAEGPDENVTFSNLVCHDAAYLGLPFRSRRRLHGLVAGHIESSTEHPDRIAALLCTHFSEAKQHTKCWTYGVLAGDAARAGAATHEAAQSYLRALESARYAADVESEDLTTVATHLAEAELLLGRSDESRRWLQYARKHNQDAPTEIMLMRQLGRIEERAGKYGDALRWWSRAESKIEPETDDPALVLERALIGLERGSVLHRRGDNETVLATAELALADARACGDAPTEARALERIHLARTYLPGEVAEPDGLKALAAFQELGDHEAQSRVLNNLGINAYFAGDWTTAEQRYGEAMEAAMTAGSAINGSLGGLNQAEILSDQGRWEEAIEVLGPVLRNFRAARYVLGSAVALLYLGVAHRRRGDWSEARERLSTALELLEAEGVEGYVPEAKSRLLEVDLYQGRVNPEALAAFRATLAPTDGAWARTCRASALTSHLVGDPQTARTEMEAAIEAASGYERAIGLRGLAHVAADAPEVSDWLSEATEIFARHGVDRIADFPN